MKKIWLLAFSFLIFLLSFTPLSGAFAQEILPTPTPQINYELPYPGLLPDSPLYFLRVTRDKIVGFLISDPLKKAEFNLLQADKRLNAGIYLVNKGKISLAISTISKAQNYFSEALDRMEDAKREGRNVDEMKGKLKNAVQKHKQEIGFLIKKSSANFKQSFKKEQERAAGFERRLDH